MTHKRLFIPGPVEVDPGTLAASARPMIGHRGAEFRELYQRVSRKLSAVLETARPVYLATGSATMIMEAAVVNCVERRCLHLASGAFAERWAEISRARGVPCDVLSVPWGRAIDPAAVDRELRTGKYDAVAVVYSETSTGVLNPVPDIASVVRRHEGVQLLVDAVSVLGAKRIPVDELGLDVVLAGIQKAFACPPGLVVFAASQRAMARSRRIANKGFFLDFVAYEESHVKGETITTPAISLFFALEHALGLMEAEGLENVHARHEALSQRARAWAAGRFPLYPDAEHVTPTLTCLSAPPGFDLAGLHAHMGKRGISLGKGYGKIKDTTFRIAHMGRTTLRDLEEVLSFIDEFRRGVAASGVV